MSKFYEQVHFRILAETICIHIEYQNAPVKMIQAKLVAVIIFSALFSYTIKIWLMNILSLLCFSKVSSEVRS